MNEKDKMIGYLTQAAEIGEMFRELKMSIEKVEIDKRKTTFVIQTFVHNYEFLDIDSNLEDKLCEDDNDITWFKISICDDNYVELRIFLSDKEGFNFIGTGTKFSHHCHKTGKELLYDSINVRAENVRNEVYDGPYGDATNDTIKIKNAIYFLMKEAFKKYNDLLVEFYK